MSLHRAITVLLPALIVLAASGCAAPAHRSSDADPIRGTIEKTLVSDGQNRSYILYVPDSYSTKKPIPLLLNFHGYGGTAKRFMEYGDFRSVADTAGFIIAHPQGSLLDSTTHWNVGGWTVKSTVDDVSFALAVIDAVAAEYSVDRSRIYSTGHSNGGYMSFVLACQASDKIAAIASVTGAMTPQTLRDCEPGRSMPVLQIHGTADDVVPYDGGEGWTLAVDRVLEYWVGENSCSSEPVTSKVPDRDPSDNSTVEHLVYPCNQTGVSVEHLRVLGGEHTWPGAPTGRRITNNDVHASSFVWRFLSRYKIQTPG